MVRLKPMNNVLGGGWLVRKPVQQAPRIRLFCFPYAGVGASAYRLWAAGLPAAIETCAIQLPGRESRLREPALKRIDAIVAALVPVLRPHLDLPFAFFGHSMGAIVASELTAALARDGGPMPTHVFLSARRAPHLPDPDSPLSGLDDDRFVAEINRRYGGIPPEVAQDREILELLLPCLRSDIEALESHRANIAPQIACPLAVFGGTEDRRATRAELEAWSTFATGPFRVRMFSGDHFYINPCRAEVLADVAATLLPNSGREGTANTVGRVA
jgi:medium-chain acyl-[acyl-carrier-protein] hydrolase